MIFRRLEPGEKLSRELSPGSYVRVGWTADGWRLFAAIGVSVVVGTLEGCSRGGAAEVCRSVCCTACNVARRRGGGRRTPPTIDALPGVGDGTLP